MEAPLGGDQNRGKALVAILWVQTSISIVAVILRLWGRFLIRNFGADDVFMVVSLVLLVTFCSITTYLASLGGFRHLFYLTGPESQLALRTNWISQPFVIFGLATGKSSVALLIIRFLSRSMKIQRIMLYAIVVLTLLISSVGVIITYIQCDPVRALWIPALQTPGVCWDTRIQARYETFTAVWNVVIDIFLALLPTTILWQIKISTKKKFGLCALLGLGLIAAVIGGIKTSYLSDLTARSDFTWMTYDIYNWSTAELFVTILCGCAPAIKPLYDHFGKNHHRKVGYTSYSLSERDNLSSSKMHPSSAIRSMRTPSDLDLEGDFGNSPGTRTSRSVNTGGGLPNRGAPFSGTGREYSSSLPSPGIIKKTTIEVSRSK